MKTKPVATRLSQNQLALIITALRRHNLPAPSISKTLNQALGLFVTLTDSSIPQLPPEPAALAEAQYLLEGRKAKPDFWGSSAEELPEAPSISQPLSREAQFLAAQKLNHHIAEYPYEIQTQLANILSYLTTDKLTLSQIFDPLAAPEPKILLATLLTKTGLTENSILAPYSTIITQTLQEANHDNS